ncbi:hypothetical protein LT493_14840, partial [Streptomyces tricolor]|nr:hypothetical protein [Streptomyces tricolor]
MLKQIRQRQLFRRIVSDERSIVGRWSGSGVTPAEVAIPGAINGCHLARSREVAERGITPAAP